MADVSAELALELVESCLKGGERDTADRFAKQIVRNNHDDEGLLSQIVATYDQAGFGADGKQMVGATKEETAAVNNQGVRLLKTGKVDESIKFFADALKGMPQNPVVNLNAAYSLTLSMKGGQVSRRRSAEVKNSLDAARAANANPKGYQKVLGRYQKLATSKLAS